MGSVGANRNNVSINLEPVSDNNMWEKVVRAMDDRTLDIARKSTQEDLRKAMKNRLSEEYKLASKNNKIVMDEIQRRRFGRK